MSNKFDVVSYKESVAFDFTNPETNEKEQIHKELTLIFEDSIDKFLEEHGKDVEHFVKALHTQQAKEKYIDSIDERNEEIIDQVEEEISCKMKFSFDYTSPLHED